MRVTMRLPRRNFEEARDYTPCRRAASAPAYRQASHARSRADDPFFDKPYEASGSGGAAWEAANKMAAQPAGAASRGLSPHIKPRRKVASLLGGSQ